MVPIFLIFKIELPKNRGPNLFEQNEKFLQLIF
jgi:hypothetical protein